MAAAGGYLIQLLREDTATPGTYVRVATMKTQALSLNNNVVDTTTVADVVSDVLWSDGAYTVKSIEFSGDGIAKSNTDAVDLLEDGLQNRYPNMQVVVPHFGTFEFAAIVSDFEMSGPHDDVVDFSMTLRNSGVVTFAAEAGA